MTIETRAQQKQRETKEKYDLVRKINELTNSPVNYWQDDKQNNPSYNHFSLEYEQHLVRTIEDKEGFSNYKEVSVKRLSHIHKQWLEEVSEIIKKLESNELEVINNKFVNK